MLQLHHLNLHALLVVVLWKVLAETVGLGLPDVFRRRNLVMNGLGMVLPYKQRLRDGVVGWGTVSGLKEQQGSWALSRGPTDPLPS